MRYLINLLAVSLLVSIIVGCSSNGEKSPILPSGNDTGLKNEAQNPLDPDSIIYTEIQSPLFSDLTHNNTNDDPSGILYAGILELDAENGSITNSPDREILFNYNITSFLFAGGCPGGCFRYTLNSIVDEIWDIDVTIENPTNFIVYDVRLIFTALGNKTIENSDGYTDLYDPPGGPFINPFIAFAKDQVLRSFPIGPGGIDTQNLLLNFEFNW